MDNHKNPRNLKAYPVQTWTEYASTISATAPESNEEPPRLPNTIRALRDSGSSHSGRTLVVCLDGTGDKFDNDNSNIIQLVACLKKDDPSQVTYYQSGIGTYDGHGLLKSGFSAAIDMAVGSGLGIHIKDAYQFLMQNYCEGDKICLFGFSRGSYTVRCLAGMLHKVGLLPAHNQAQLSFAYQFYKDDSPEGFEMSEGFKKTFCMDVNVYFVGVWDCVASVGFIPRKLPFSKSPTNTIGYFRHAMALDEHRAKFEVCQWQQQNPASTALHSAKDRSKKKLRIGPWSRIPSFDSRSQTNGTKHRLANGSTKSFDNKKSDDKKEARLESEFEKYDDIAHEHRVTDALEVWFLGAHADVGGGAVNNNERHMLSRIPLRWMIRQCFECNTGILFSTAALAEAGIDVPSVWPSYKTPKEPVVGPSPHIVEKYEAGVLPPLRRRSAALGVDEDGKRRREYKGHADLIRRFSFSEEEERQLEADLLPEQVEDHFDAIAPINDQLVLAKGWWILEIWPVKVQVQRKKTEEWEKVVRMNMGRFRAIRETEPKMHWTVQTRINHQQYRIKNRLDEDAVWQIAV